MKLADEVATLVKVQKPAATATTVATTGKSTSAPIPSDALVGFNVQEFEASPLDELSKLELTQEELQVDENPVAQQQYLRTSYAGQCAG